MKWDRSWWNFMKQEMASVMRKIFWKERENQMKTLDLYLNEQLKNEEFRK